MLPGQQSQVCISAAPAAVPAADDKLCVPKGGRKGAFRPKVYLNTSCGNVTALFRCMERLPDSPLVPQLVLLGASPLDRCIRNPSKEQSTPLHLAITARQARGVVAACLGAVGVTTACCNTMLPANASMSS